MVDLLLIPLCLYSALALRYGSLEPLNMLETLGVWIALLTLAGIPITYFLRLWNIKLHAFENRAILQVALLALTLGTAAMMISYLFGLATPRSGPLIFAALFFMSALGVRFGALYLLGLLANHAGNRVPVVIYGAGAAGIQLTSALRQSREIRPIAFIDDNPSLRGLMVAGLPVCGRAKLDDLIAAGKAERVLLAIPSASRARQNELIKSLSDLPIEVQSLPSYVDLMSGKSIAESLRPVDPDEILGRDKVDLDIPQIAKAYAGRVVMVTGAGGSIGSELCRQLLNCKPAAIVLFEQSEFGLYSIDRELRSLAEHYGVSVISRLGSVTNKPRVVSVIKEEGVEIILHAAAYKHVPLVEENEIEGARNNVLGTRVVAEAALAAGVERFILISTDKAVRPTNVMGATKRMAELTVQDIQTRSPKTKFAMVRFGNVLGSSGSVLPLFQSQITAGGPVTVTHTEVTRFFMTIPEAARLVLLAGAFAEGGDVFVLDMGEPRRILDIAHQMIELSGVRVKDPETGEGDIEIRITGLRPGEKLYEELLIDDDSLTGTPHEKILRAEETMLSQIEVVAMLRELEAAIEDGDEARLRTLIEQRVEGYHRQDEGTPQETA